jgi:hypothetical protein
MYLRSFRRALLAVALALPAAAHAQVTLRVDPSAAPGGNGLTWATAFPGIKSAVTAAIANPAVTEIWVKQGTYFPGTTPYTLRNGLTMYGGFTGNETSRDQRNPTVNVTTLTGQNTRRIINGGVLDSTAVIDGFTIRDAYASSGGAAVGGGGMTFRGCRFIENRSDASGGVWYSYDRTITFIDCRFIGNEADEGAVADTYEGSIRLISCRIVGNLSPDNGAVVTSYDGRIELVNSLLVQNTGGIGSYEGPVNVFNSTIADQAGPGVGVFTGPGITVRNSVIWNNAVNGPRNVAYSCLQGGATGEGNTDGDPLFVDPAARDYRLGLGAAAIDAGSNALLPADEFDLDRDGDVAEPLPLDHAALPRRRDTAQSPDTGSGKAPIVDMGCLEHYPDCNRNSIEDSIDIASGTSSDLDANGTPDECEDCNDNSLPDSIDIATGTSLDCQPDGTPDECQLATVTPRTYRLDDGTIENYVGLVSGGDVVWLNRHEVVEGGEIVREIRAVWGPDLPVGAIAYVLVWSDPNQDGNPDDARVKANVLVEVAATSATSPQPVPIPPTYIGPAGTRFFLGALASGGTGLAPLDQGTPSQQRSWIAADGGGVDPNDLGSAAVFGLVDTYLLPGDWFIRAVASRDLDCNGNGIPDDCDIEDGAADCQGDGIPDSCQLVANDCDANGLPDDCDLAAGAPDCQVDGIPDSCQVASGESADLDANGRPDECEDCDGDTIPDSLEIAAGSADCQPDGIPDECQLGSSAPVEYALDDGNPEYYVSSTAPYMAWLMNFRVEDDRRRITAVNVQFGPMPVGASVDVFVWNDPNGDGNPADSQVISQLTGSIADPASGAFERFDVPDVDIGENGTSFFVGAIVNFVPLTHYPGAKDTMGITNTAWLVGRYSEIDPNDLSAGADEFVKLDDLGGPFVGVWCLRAETVEWNDCNGNSVPDDCDIEDGTSQDADGDGVPDECGPGCVADLDGDGIVGPSDLSAILGAWGTPKRDLDGDGITGAGDLSVLLSAWGDC